ncbi:hypothetical protein ZHAS_00013162 [Anopheles sinensis]|uniref:Uncharacterized protein n=1 Tax=Anopheles sinensis TaxID=74873 RepID=A0A084W4Q5_ANOSI|nr:hypothetical protein ZHAS_00013162 [Anopheles sinensis]
MQLEHPLHQTGDFKSPQSVRHVPKAGISSDSLMCRDHMEVSGFGLEDSLVWYGLKNAAAFWTMCSPRPQTLRKSGMI